MIKQQRILKPRRTKPLVWVFASVCAALALAVVVAGAAVISVYLAYRPKAPVVRVVSTHLDHLAYDQQEGLLDVLLTVDMEAANPNGRTAAAFSAAEFDLLFARTTTIARLRADAFEVPKNGTLPLHYVVASSGAKLEEGGMEKMQVGLRRGLIELSLRGRARTRWRVGLLPVKLWTHLDCELHYFFPNGSSPDLKDCTSKSH
ncbi:hypothetical protein Taro_056074 [Colocasia esculenta]|uniref:Late embryogenesis abundant protein LEA-2 subgroup domain-containing protein n=1 Tax=Colocasia esculenta TaxID=4460 RepID=A0A843XV46_COLES|nr:hypothetical protein [Colocasia esculenta]